jgi:hypothetical protein
LVLWIAGSRIKYYLGSFCQYLVVLIVMQKDDNATWKKLVARPPEPASRITTVIIPNGIRLVMRPRILDCSCLFRTLSCIIFGSILNLSVCLANSSQFSALNILPEDAASFGSRPLQVAGLDGVEIVRSSATTQEVLDGLPFNLNAARSRRIRLAAQSSSAVSMLQRMESDLKQSV